ncbi:MAG: flagellar hook-length control protein FliK [Rickettsiales bacterium]
MEMNLTQTIVSQGAQAPNLEALLLQLGGTSQTLTQISGVTNGQVSDQPVGQPPENLHPSFASFLTSPTPTPVNPAPASEALVTPVVMAEDVNFNVALNQAFNEIEPTHLPQPVAAAPAKYQPVMLNVQEIDTPLDIVVAADIATVALAPADIVEQMVPELVQLQQAKPLAKPQQLVQTIPAQAPEVAQELNVPIAEAIKAPLTLFSEKVIIPDAATQPAQQQVTQQTSEVLVEQVALPLLTQETIAQHQPQVAEQQVLQQMLPPIMQQQLLPQVAEQQVIQQKLPEGLPVNYVMSEIASNDLTKEELVPVNEDLPQQQKGEVAVNQLVAQPNELPVDEFAQMVMQSLETVEMPPKQQFVTAVVIEDVALPVNEELAIAEAPKVLELAEISDAKLPAEVQMLTKKFENIKFEQPEPQALRAVANQVAVKISELKNSGESSIVVQLEPKQLGKIDIIMDVKANGDTKLMILSEKFMTLDLLQKSTQQLESILNDHGLKTSGSNISFGLRNENNSHQGHQKQNFNETEFTKVEPINEVMAQVHYMSADSGRINIIIG